MRSFDLPPAVCSVRAQRRRRPSCCPHRCRRQTLMLRVMRGSTRTRGGVTTSRRVTGGAQEHQSVNAHARSAAAADELLLAVRIASASTAVLYGRCDPGSAVSTRGPKAGQRAAAGCDAARTHAGGAVLTFAQQQQQQCKSKQQAAGSSSLSLHVLLDSSSDID